MLFRAGHISRKRLRFSRRIRSRQPRLTLIGRATRLLPYRHAANTAPSAAAAPAPAGARADQPAQNIPRHSRFHLLHLPSRSADANGAIFHGQNWREKIHVPATFGAPRAMALMWRLVARGTHPGKPRGLLVVWPRWEHFVHHMWPIKRVPGAPHGLIQLRFGQYQGDEVRLPDDTVVRAGALIGELHCDNLAILNLVINKGNPYRACREDLRHLAQWLEFVDPERRVEALYGVTMIAVAGARLGFFVRERPPSLKASLDRWFMSGLLLLYTVDGLSRLHRGSTLRTPPREVWMSRRELLHRYGAGAGERPRRCNPAS
jgi:YkoP domain